MSFFLLMHVWYLLIKTISIYIIKNFYHSLSNRGGAPGILEMRNADHADWRDMGRLVADFLGPPIVSVECAGAAKGDVEMGGESSIGDGNWIFWVLCG
jgi:hypothetical protein